jgi:hypothetical protein
MIAPQRSYRKGFLQLENMRKTNKSGVLPITKTLKPPTITPYFGQSTVMLASDIDTVASRPGPVGVPDSSAPQPPGALPAGPVEFQYGL